MTARPCVAAGAACAAGLALRVAVIVLCRESGLYSDMLEYYDRATLLRERGLRDGLYAFDAWRLPAYPLFLWATQQLGGVTLLVPRLTQALLGAASVGLTYVLARQVVAHRSALAAAWVVAVYPAFALFSLYLASETLFTFLMLAGLWLWLRDGRLSAAGAGLVFGLATLTRAAGIAAIPAVMMATWAVGAAGAAGAVGAAGAAAAAGERRSPASLRARLGWLVAIYVVVLTPWAVRNAHIYGRFIPLDTNGGFNFLVGNNPEATGRFEWEDQARLPRTYYPTARTDAEIAEVGFREGLAHISAHPLQSARLALVKLGYLAGLEGREHVWLYSVGYFGPLQPATIWAWGVALILAFPLVAVPGVFGALTPGVLSTEVGAASVTILGVSGLLHAVSFGEARFHLPLIPFVAILAARVLETGPPWSPARWSRWRHVAAAVLLLALVSAWWGQWSLLVERLAAMAAAGEHPPALIY